ncbi:MAG: hypothetical protein Q4B85_07270 [Lachnospiraceae bacterium]|nr:hypothetical protein [Lachnospiraceae bacterium]
MSRSYHEIMEKIEVTEEMRSRILSNVASKTEERPAKIIPFRRVRKIATIAACLALLLLSGTVLKQVVHLGKTQPEEMILSPVGTMVECSSVKELTENAGFSMEEVMNLPFDADSVSYTWDGLSVAEIMYTGSENSLIYRKGVGTEDISGDYSEYEQVRKDSVGDISVTVKGNQNLYVLATWCRDGYSYAISLEQGIALEDMRSLVEGVSKSDHHSN